MEKTNARSINGRWCDGCLISVVDSESLTRLFIRISIVPLYRSVSMKTTVKRGLFCQILFANWNWSPEENGVPPPAAFCILSPISAPTFTLLLLKMEQSSSFRKMENDSPSSDVHWRKFHRFTVSLMTQNAPSNVRLGLYSSLSFSHRSYFWKFIQMNKNSSSSVGNLLMISSGKFVWYWQFKQRPLTLVSCFIQASVLVLEAAFENSFRWTKIGSNVGNFQERISSF